MHWTLTASIFVLAISATCADRLNCTELRNQCSQSIELFNEILTKLPGIPWPVYRNASTTTENRRWPAIRNFSERSVDTGRCVEKYVAHCTNTSQSSADYEAWLLQLKQAAVMGRLGQMYLALDSRAVLVLAASGYCQQKNPVYAEIDSATWMARSPNESVDEHLRKICQTRKEAIDSLADPETPGLVDQCGLTAALLVYLSIDYTDAAFSCQQRLHNVSLSVDTNALFADFNKEFDKLLSNPNFLIDEQLAVYVSDN